MLLVQEVAFNLLSTLIVVSLPSCSLLHRCAPCRPFLCHFDDCDVVMDDPPLVGGIHGATNGHHLLDKPTICFR